MTVILAELTLPLASSNTVEPSSTRVALFSDREYPGADPRLIGDVRWLRASSSAIWSRQPAGSTDVAIELANADGGLDWLLSIPVRDAVLRVQWFDEAEPTPLMTISTLYPTRIEAPDESRVVVICTDILGRLSVPLTQAKYGSENPEPLQDRPYPVALGYPLSVPLVLVDDVDYYYDAHDVDDAVPVERVRDAGAVLTPIAQWIDRPKGIELLQLPVATVVADLRAGAFVELTEFDTDCAAWAADPGSTVVPDGWNYSTQGGGDVGPITIPDAGLYLRIGSIGVGTDSAEVTAADSFDPGELVFEIVVSESLFSAALTVHWGAASHTISEPGTHRFQLSNTGYNDPTLRVTEAVSTTFPGAIITRIKITRRELTGGQGRIDAVARVAFERALPASLYMFDDTAWEAAAAAASDPDVGYWSASAPDVRAVITQLCDSALLLPFGDAAGNLSVRALDAPGARTPSITIDDWQIAGEVRLSPDRLENVPTAVVGGRNWHVYGDDELADALEPADCALLTTEHRFTAPIAAMGAEVKRGARSLKRLDSDESIRDPAARSAVGYPTLLGSQASCAALAARIAALIPPGRVARWIEFEAFVARGVLAQAAPGDVVSLTCARWGLVDQRCILVEVAGEAGSLRASWLLWTTLEAIDE